MASVPPPSVCVRVCVQQQVSRRWLSGHVAPIFPVTLEQSPKHMLGIQIVLSPLWACVLSVFCLFFNAGSWLLACLHFIVSQACSSTSADLGTDLKTLPLTDEPNLTPHAPGCTVNVFTSTHGYSLTSQKSLFLHQCNLTYSNCAYHPRWWQNKPEQHT